MCSPDVVIDVNGCPGVVVLVKTGIRYTNQAGGILCLHPVEEGLFIELWKLMPWLNDEPDQLLSHELTAKIAAVFSRAEERWYKTCAELWFKEDLDPNHPCVQPPRINEREADEIDRILARYSAPFRVDRKRLNQSMEAWLYVVFTGGRFRGLRGVLTWLNSD